MEVGIVAVSMESLRFLVVVVVHHYTDHSCFIIDMDIYVVRILVRNCFSVGIKTIFLETVNSIGISPNKVWVPWW